MTRKTIEKGVALLHDLDTAEKLLEVKPWNVTIEERGAFGSTYFRFKTEAAQREITEFARNVYNTLKKEFENLHEEQQEEE